MAVFLNINPYRTSQNRSYNIVNDYNNKTNNLRVMLIHAVASIL